MHDKFRKIKEYLTKMQGIYLAFSGGTDSTLLLYLCKDLDITAVTFYSVFQTKEEINLTQALCKEYNIKHKLIEFYPLEQQNLKNNPKDRCYHCKKLFFTELKKIAGKKQIIDGTNYDDLKVHRPGLKALEELNIISPFAEYKITKQEIRDYSRELGLKTYNRPSTPCLATRFPYNTELTAENLELVEQGEKIIKTGGFENCRLRLHNNIARIELPVDKFNAFLSSKIPLKLKQLGFKYVTLDTEGIRSIDIQDFII